MWHAHVGHSMHYVDCDLPPAGRPKHGFAMPADISVRRAQPAAAVAFLSAQRIQDNGQSTRPAYYQHIIS